MKSLISCLVGLALTLPAVSQESTNLWLRYALRVPLSDTWTWHNEPDYRVQVAPNGGAFRQALFRSDLLWKPSGAHQFGIGVVGVHTTFKTSANSYEWRSVLTYFLRPSAIPNLLLRTRLEWREQNVNVNSDREVTISTLRCRGLAQYDIPLRKEGSTMRTGIRTQAEILLRGYSSVDLSTFDQGRTSVGYVKQFGKALEVEGTWIGIFRNNGIVQHYLRIGFVQKLKPRDRTPNENVR